VKQGTAITANLTFQQTPASGSGQLVPVTGTLTWTVTAGGATTYQNITGLGAVDATGDPPVQIAVAETTTFVLTVYAPSLNTFTTASATVSVPTIPPLLPPPTAVAALANAVSAVPAGWLACTKSNAGTVITDSSVVPNLENLFVCGGTFVPSLAYTQGTSNIAGVGHTHNTTSVSAIFTSSEDPDHTHSIPGSWGQRQACIGPNSQPTLLCNGNSDYSAAITAAAGSHSHGCTVSFASKETMADAVEIACYALTYIVKKDVGQAASPGGSAAKSEG
jgi:hypothetical protein